MEGFAVAECELLQGKCLVPALDEPKACLDHGFDALQIAQVRRAERHESAKAVSVFLQIW